jgi:hypothetical protein
MDAKGFVLLVDDDEGDDYETYFQNALMASGYIYDYWNHDSEGTPSSATMSQYSAVVWFCGDDSSTTLQTADISALTTYLDGGGRLFVTGQDIGYDIRTTPFYSNYLHATYGVDDTNVVDLDGVAGCPIGDGLDPQISSGDGANNQAYPSGITVISPGTQVFTYHNNPYTAGLKVEEGTPSYRIVYFAFGFEAISTIYDRNTVMNRTINWLATGGSYTLSDVTLDPTTLDYLTSPGSLITDTLTLGNHVDATENLTYEFTNLPAGVSVTPSSGSLIPAQTQSLSLSIDTTYLDGTYSHFFLTLNTNDPDESTLSIPVYVSLGGIPLDLSLYTGWNLITVPFDADWTAADLGQAIPGCTVIVSFNALTQMYCTHVVGIPYNDFPIEPGVGYFIYVTGDTSILLGGKVISEVSVSIEPIWNIIGWCQDDNTTAGDLGLAINGTTVVVMFNAHTQQYMTHVVTIPYKDFPITRGMGLFIYTSEHSQWNGYD